MEVKELFSGIAVIIDDEIEKQDSSIYRIREILEKGNVPVAVFNSIPHVDVIPSFSSASFVILDWDYAPELLEGTGSERVKLGASLQESENSDLIRFISALVSTVFVPVFVFTFKAVESIQKELEENGLWHTNKPNRIFIRQKSDVKSEEELFGAIGSWLADMPSVYVLKKWENSVASCKSKMFLDLYNHSPNWAKVIWNMIKEDSIEYHQEFGEFITRTLKNRSDAYQFDEAILDSSEPVAPDELRRVLESERYVKYEVQPNQAYVGDLFLQSGKYYLNIRAQCDLSRANPEGEYNPTLYCIKGKTLRPSEIVHDNIKLTKDGKIEFGSNRSITIDELKEACQDESRISDINKGFAKHASSILFRKGTFIERNDKVIISCVADKEALQFDLEICTMSFMDIKSKRIGRILPPYITRIQQKCSLNMIREGVLPTPKELFQP